MSSLPLAERSFEEQKDVLREVLRVNEDSSDDGQTDKMDESALRKPRQGLIHVYTGDGKGKTTAAMGLALRAVGQNIQVFVIQFMKGGHYTGELLAAERFLEGRMTFRQFGRGCIREDKQTRLAAFGAKVQDAAETESASWHFEFARDDEPCGTCRYCFVNDKTQKELCEDAAALAKKVVASGEYGVVVLDELSCAVSYGMLPLERALEILDAKHSMVELVITGRGALQKIIERADLVTNMTLVKHYYDDQGVLARRGVEY